MRHSSKKKDAHPAPTDKVGVELVDFVDSGWRVALAFLSPALFGIWLDREYFDDKVFTVLGVLIGFVLAHVVVSRYVKSRYAGDLR